MKLAVLHLAGVVLLSSAAAAQCAGTVQSTYTGTWPFGTRTVSWAKCLGACTPAPTSCAIQTDASGSHQWCGCPGQAEHACCHMTIDGYFAPGTGRFVPTTHNFEGDCPNCATTGDCLFDGVPMFGFSGTISVVCGW